ncbi:bifunctional adenosylcobinamide kinase/adenosylcobinamide-phosphate guanylyltransferase [Pseudoroseicyclus sp. H15]
MAAAFTLVIGGAASGKSVFAERLVAAGGGEPVYIATAEAYDAEMEYKISKHRARRGAGWREVEAPRDLAAAIRSCQQHEIVLIDCATMWLTNALLAGDDLAARSNELLAAIAASPARLVMVTNEIGLSPVPDNALARQFREAQGALNQQLAAAATRVVAIWAGLPLELK